MANIAFQVGGAYHFPEEQVTAIIQWLAADHGYQSFDGARVFEALDDVDLLVLMGMHWPGMAHASAGGYDYAPMQDHHRTAFERYLGSGRPLLLHHAAIFSYSDWPRFRELAGFWWDWNASSFVNVVEYQVEVKPTAHPIVAGIDRFTIVDEVYINIQIAPDFAPKNHASAYFEDPTIARHNGHTVTQEVPLVFTAEGGRIDGAGKLVYFANGHDMRAFACDALRQMWINAVAWLLA